MICSECLIVHGPYEIIGRVPASRDIERLGDLWIWVGP